jgi:hypothetical protein
MMMTRMMKMGIGTEYEKDKAQAFKEAENSYTEKTASCYAA